MEMTHCELPGIPRVATGKVREIFDLGDHLLFVATDRISAFDCILPNPIPDKGRVLTQLSAFWFRQFKEVPNHMVTADFAEFPDSLRAFMELDGRAMIVHKCKPLPVECVVRGYLAGSGWKEYHATGGVCGVPLPSGLHHASELPDPIFTPSTKATTGHDVNISHAECEDLVGRKIASEIRERSIAIYKQGRAYAAERGIIVADTKFEWGTCDGRVVLIDECLTPDSSRFWPAERWRPGTIPPSYDKQPVRDYLDGLGWDKRPPAPALPDHVVRDTSDRYRLAYEQLVGKPLW
jgi:phosphoribosylaminoimidazole-succinocarboxamide synthase